MIGIVFSIALLLVIGYFAVLCATEAIHWLRDRADIQRPTPPTLRPVPQRQPATVE